MSVGYNPEEKKKLIGEFFKMKRKKAGLTHLEIANKLDHSRLWYQNIESGKNRVYFDDASSICDVLETSVEMLDRYMKDNLSHKDSDK